ncbi:hypothetical protein F5Y19DRAFT_490090 [Xylariaceae sp. FL1651]|nr:hypothetical protein F5Y19DRAFT_490090 [Xylariaceae sp. FL1651]
MAPHTVGNGMYEANGTNGTDDVHGANGISATNATNGVAQNPGLSMSPLTPYLSPSQSPSSPDRHYGDGLVGRIGGDVTSPSKLWGLCASGQEGWAPIPAQRFDVNSLYHPDETRIGRVSSSTLNSIMPYAWELLLRHNVPLKC